jgi:radical SAM-linked protein
VSLWPQIEKVLLRVEKPARYVGAEVGGPTTCRGDEPAAATIVLAFPDLYEIGASYHGFRVLYERINAHPQFRAERAFAPWGDFERELRAAAIPLHTIETFRPVREFDVVGFTLQHEMSYTTVLNMLDLAGLPVRASERSNAWPLVIAGGEGALAPEVLAPFVDAFVLGDGEEAILEILDCIAELKRSSALTNSLSENQVRVCPCPSVPAHVSGFRIGSKRDCLRALAKIEGVYVPSFVEFDYAPDGTIAAIRAAGGGSDSSSSMPRFRRRFFDLASDEGPARPIVPLARIVHDRLVVEIRRGCTRGCRFCSSGMTTRPVRERPPEQVVQIAEQGLAATGYRDLSLLSLSSGDYSQIVPLVKALTQRFSDRMVAISLPSLRISTFDVALAEQIGEVRKTGFTFAPEAGSERLRRVINKPLADEQFCNVVDAVCRAGWQTLKLYFMIGLPTENDEDLDAIVAMVRRAEQIGRSHWRNRLAINVTLAPFVPKPHTPFQWEPQVERGELERRYRRVEEAFGRSRCVHIKRHSVEGAFIEAVLARGDRRVADAVERAWRLGCRLDAWSDCFRFDLWQRAFEETGVDPAWYANRLRGENEVFPWDHIGAGPIKAFLLQQREAARRGELLDDCTRSECSGCQVCGKNVKHRLAAGASKEIPSATDSASPPAPPREEGRGRRRTAARPQPPKAAADQPPPVQRIRLSYSKGGRLRFLSHLDMVKAWQLLVERARLPMAYSRGFHPVALLQYSPPLPVGYAAQAEWVDLFLRERVAPEEVARRLEEAAPRDMRLFAPVEIDVGARALDRSIVAADYEIRLAAAFSATHSTTANQIEKAWREARHGSAARAEAVEATEKASRAAMLLESLEVGSNDPSVLRLRVRQSEGNLTDPLRLLNALLGIEIRSGEDADVTRVGLVGSIPLPGISRRPRE